MGRQNHHASLKQAKKDLIKEKIRSPNDVWKGYLKTWDRWNKASRGTVLRPHKGAGGLQRPIWIHSFKGQRAEVLGLWPTAIKLNPSWKTAVGKNAWIKPCVVIRLQYLLYFVPNFTFSSINLVTLPLKSPQQLGHSTTKIWINTVNGFIVYLV